MNISVEELQKLADKSRSYRELGILLGCYHRKAKELCILHKINVEKIESLYKDESKIGTKNYGLKVIEIKKVRSSNGVLRKVAVCECFCGKITETRYDNIKNNHVLSCGCLTRYSKRGLLKGLSPCYKGVGELSANKFCDIKKSAKKRNIEFNITINEVWELYIKQNKKCALSGLEIVFGPQNTSMLTTASLDRIDSSKGYTIDNVQWVHKDVNKMKTIFNQSYFIEMCILVANNQK